MSEDSGQRSEVGFLEQKETKAAKFEDYSRNPDAGSDWKEVQSRLKG